MLDQITTFLLEKGFVYGAVLEVINRLQKGRPFYVK